MRSIALLLYFGILFFCSCTEKNKSSIAHINLEDALYFQNNGNLEYALHFFRLVKGNVQKDDSISYWVKAVIGESQIFIVRNDLIAARKNFVSLQEFAKRRNLPEEECLAWQRLGQIASSLYEPVLADSCYKEAIQLSVKLEKQPLPYLQEEAVIAEGNLEMMRKGALSDSTYQKLMEMQEIDSEELKVASLKLLTIQAAKATPGGENLLSLYIRTKEKLTEESFKEYSDLQENEKAQLVLERDKQTRARQLTLFISLGTFALMICVGLYLLVNYRRRHELDRIQRILAEQELEIYRLEQKSDELNKVRNMLHESEKAVTELECRNKELDKVRSLLKDKEEQFGELKERFNEVNQMREQIRRKEKELKEAEDRLLAQEFYRRSSIASRIPSTNNPVKLEEKDFKGIFWDKNLDEFLEEYNTYFNNFATRLHEINPKLTKEDLLYCCLFRMNVRPSDIALMLGVSRNTVSMRRKRIEEKMQ